jgi:hypothetical protein
MKKETLIKYHEYKIKESEYNIIQSIEDIEFHKNKLKKLKK